MFALYCVDVCRSPVLVFCSSHPYLPFLSVAYSLLQTGNWVCEETDSQVKGSLSRLIKVWLFVGRSPADRLERAYSGLTGSGWTGKQTIGVWWMDPDSLSLSETCSASLGVNLTQCQHGLGQSTAQSHWGERTRWAERLEKKPSFAAGAARTHSRLWVKHNRCMNSSYMHSKKKKKSHTNNSNLHQLISNSTEPD